MQCPETFPLCLGVSKAFVLGNVCTWETQPYRSARLAWGCAASESPSAGRLTADVAPDCCWRVRRFYMMSPKHCHAFVGYLEEEAVKTCMPCA